MAKSFVEGIDRLLFDFAHRSVALSTAVTEIRWEHGGTSASGIILASAGVEAHVGEWLAESGERAGIPFETWRGWTEDRTTVAEIIKLIFKEIGGPNVGGLAWFQNLKALTTLRNHVVHYYPMRREPGTWPEALAPYIENRTIKPAGDETMDWTSRLLVSAVAEQALQFAKAARDGFDQEVARAVR